LYDVKLCDLWLLVGQPSFRQKANPGAKQTRGLPVQLVSEPQRSFS
jgi:hypothetical protein